MIEMMHQARTTHRKITTNCWNSVSKIYISMQSFKDYFVELDLELSESSLMSKVERKKQFVTNMQSLNDKKQR